MGDLWPSYPSDVQGGDEPTHSPTKNQNSLLAAQRGTQQTRRIETDEDGNIHVNLAASNPSGTFAYHSGASGTVAVPVGQRVTGIAAHSTIGGSLTINGGSSIIIPANTAVEIRPTGDLTAPTIVFTDTDAYVIEVVI